MRPIRNPNIEHREKLKPVEKLALWITKHVGSMGFFFIVLTWTILWFGWNILAPHEIRFDPAPAFVMWLFISNMIQLFLLPLLMIGQNLQSRHAEMRAETDFEVNLKSAEEIEEIRGHLKQILNHLKNSKK